MGAAVACMEWCVCGTGAIEKHEFECLLKNYNMTDEATELILSVFEGPKVGLVACQEG